MEQGMRYVYEVYLERSFSRAAEKLYISQPALSIAVRKVEEQLGVSLFDRRSQPLGLTPAGEIYMQQVRRVMMVEDDLLAQINDLTQLQKGHLRVGGTHYFNAYVLPPVLAAFQQKYPGVKLQLKEAVSNRIHRELTEGNIDLMISATDFDERVFWQRSIFYDHILLVVPHGLLNDHKLVQYAIDYQGVREGVYLTRDCPTIPLKHFSDLPFLILTAGNNLHTRSLTMCRNGGFAPDIRLMVEQFTTAYALSCAGLGVSFASTLLIKKSPEAPVSYFRLDSPLADRSFRAFMRQDAYKSHAVEAFLDLFQQIYPQACPL